MQRRHFLLGAFAASLAGRAAGAPDDRAGESARIELSPVFLNGDPLTRQDVEDARTLVLADAHRKEARFDWSNELGAAPVPLPSTLVRQILINLMLNAVHAIEPGGRVGSRISIETDTLRVVVTNDGAYIPQERMEFLFEPFATSRESGHGLGLWVTWQIVNQLGGTIIAQSEPGDTRFTVTLPVGASAG